MLPNFQMDPLPIFGLELHAFGFLVGLAIISGTILAGRRARALGLSERVVADVAIWAVLVGFVVSHWYSAILYFPEKVAANPIYLLEIWDGISSVGGFIGGALGVGLYFIWWRKRELPFLPYADAIIYGFAFAWIFGRLGCTIAYDHPGSPADGFFLGMMYDGSDDVSAGYRHNLGMYEFFWAIAMSTYYFFQRKKPKFKGWYLAVFIIAYAPFRFALDFLRASDSRHFGLTAAQWGLIILFGLCIWLYIKGKQAGDMLVPDGEPKYWPKSELAALERERAAKPSKAPATSKSSKKKKKR